MFEHHHPPGHDANRYVLRLAADMTPSVVMVVSGFLRPPSDVLATYTAGLQCQLVCQTLVIGTLFQLVFSPYSLASLPGLGT
jgi:hypothetical protein